MKAVKGRPAPYQLATANSFRDIAERWLAAHASERSESWRTFSPHGARAIASTALNELGWRSDAIERQLAHAERSEVRAAYNRAEYLEERRAMMQAWADMVDGIATDVNNVRPIKSASA